MNPTNQKQSENVQAEILSLLEKIKTEHPYLRLGQIIVNAITSGMALNEINSGSLFYVEDEEFLRRLQLFEKTYLTEQNADRRSSAKET